MIITANAVLYISFTEVIIMIEYTAKRDGLARFSINLKTSNLPLFLKVEDEIIKAKCKEEKTEHPDEFEKTIRVLSESQSNEKKTITITFDI